MKQNFIKTAMCDIVTVIICWTMIGCSTDVQSGYVGIKVYKMGNSKGVNQEVIGVGRYWLSWNEDLFLYPVFIQQYRFTAGKDNGDSEKDEAFYFQNKDGVKCSVDIAIQAHAIPEKAAVLFQKYRTSFHDIIKVNLRSAINSKIQGYASALSVEELYSPKKVEMIRKVEEDLRKDCEPLGITIVSVTLLSDIRFPPAVEEAINSKIKVTQEALEAQNSVVKAKANAEVKIAEARGESEAIRLKQSSITDALIRYEAVQKWNGILPTTMAGAVPFLRLP